MDYGADDSPIGLEILDPARVELGIINAALNALGLEPVDPEDLAPLEAA